MNFLFRKVPFLNTSKELKEAGLIKGEIEGVRICYCIDEEAWSQAQTYINELFGGYYLNRKLLLIFLSKSIVILRYIIHI